MLRVGRVGINLEKQPRNPAKQMKTPLLKALLAVAVAASIGSARADWAPYGAASASNANTIVQAQLNNIFDDDASSGNATTPQYGANNFSIFGATGSFAFGDAAISSFGQGIKGFAAGNGANFSGGTNLQNAAPTAFTFEVVSTILTTVSPTSTYGLAARNNFQFYVGNGALTVLLEQSAGSYVSFTASNTPAFNIGDEYHFALTYNGTDVGLFATNLSTSSSITQLTLTGSSTTAFHASDVGEHLVLGSRDPWSYPDPATPFQMDMVRYSSVAYTATDFTSGLYVVPEPGVTGLVFLSAGGLVCVARRRKNRAV